MTPQDFTYWLQGFVEITDGQMPTEKQWKIVQDHLKLVFDKQTPNRYDHELPLMPIRPNPYQDKFSIPDEWKPNVVC